MNLSKLCTQDRRKTLDERWPQGEIGDSGLDQALKVRVLETHGLGMRADGKHDAFLPGQALFDADTHVVEIAKGRHGTHIAARKGVLKFRLLSQAHILRPKARTRPVKIDARGRREYQHCPGVVGQDNHAFRDLFPRNVFTFGNPLRGIRLRMMLNLIGNLVVTQVAL